MMNDKDMRSKVNEVLASLRKQREAIEDKSISALKTASLAAALAASTKALNACAPTPEYAAPMEDAAVVDAASEDDSGIVAAYAAPFDAGVDDLAVTPDYAAPMDAGIDAGADAGPVAAYAAPFDAGRLDAGSIVDDLGIHTDYAAPFDAGQEDS